MNILVIPDVQVKPNTSIEHMKWLGEFIADKQPDVVVCIGDFADMPSLSSYDRGKKSFEGRRYKEDVRASQMAMSVLLFPLQRLQAQQRRNKKEIYKPELFLTLGNHEQRIDRAVELSPELEGVLSVSDLGYEQFGWEVLPFLEVLEIEGVFFSHYFTSGVMGRPVASPQALLTKKHVSCVMGHVQTDGIASTYTAAGNRITGIFAGTCYLHDESYLTPQGNKHWRGAWMLYDVKDGEFEPLQISLRYLKKKYGKPS